MRLNKNGIDENQTIEWLIRGEPSPLYDKLKPKFNRQPEWYKPDKGVFDLNLKLYEAIHYGSFIGKFFLAHKTNDIVRCLNPYDIFNIQNLSRMLILSCLGIWKSMLNHENPAE